MTTPLPSPQTPQPTGNGHDAKGRFLKGNKGGPGNPHARQVAALRSALLKTVTEEDMVDIAHALIFQAKQGNIAAVKLLFSYTLGKPLDGVDPDRLPENEWETLQANAIEPAQAREALGQVALETFLPVLQIATDCRQQTLKDQLLAGLHKIDQEQGAPPQGAGKPPRTQMPPSVNGPTDASPTPATGAAPVPSANERNGPPSAPLAGVLAVLLQALRAGETLSAPSGNGHNGVDPPSTNGDSTAPQRPSGESPAKVRLIVP